MIEVPVTQAPPFVSPGGNCVCGAQLAGFYSLSYATAQLLLQVGRYGVRTYQATDLSTNIFFPSIRFPALSPVH